MWLLALAAAAAAACAPVRPASIPRLGPGAEPSVGADGVIRWHGAWMRRAGPGRGLSVLRVPGTGYERGRAIGRLLGGTMAAEETYLASLLSALLPNRLVRFLLLQASSLGTRDLYRHVPADVMAEVAGIADGYEVLGQRPGWPTFRRIVGLHAVHDVSQRFVDTPFLSAACTGFAASGPAVAGGGTLLARNFDFEGGSLLERTKLVVVAVPEGKLPYLSVTFTGMAGVVSGFNGAGLGLVLHSVTGGPTGRSGTPFTLLAADVLASEKGIDGALERIRRAEVFVSDLVLLADGKDGSLALVEKTPRSFEVLARYGSGTLAAANSGRSVPPAGTSRARLARIEELLSAHSAAAQIGVPEAVAVLRDRRGLGGRPLGAGNRNAVDALIAAHSVVFDLSRRVAWVAEPPHTLGPFVPISLDGVVADALGAAPLGAGSVPPDPLLVSGGFARIVAARRALLAARGSAEGGGPAALAAGLALLEPWAREPEVSAEILATLGELRARSGELAGAREALAAALALTPPDATRDSIVALQDALTRGQEPGKLPRIVVALTPDELVASRGD